MATARPTEPHPSQVDWDGSGPFTEDVYVDEGINYGDGGVACPAEWTRQEQDELTGAWEYHIGPETSPGVIAPYLTPDALRVYVEDQTLWTSTTLPFLTDRGMPTTPDASQLLPPVWTNLSGSMVTIVTENQNHAAGNTNQTPLWPTGGCPTAWVDTAAPTWTEPGSGRVLAKIADGYMTPGELYVYRQTHAPPEPPPPPTPPGTILPADVLTFAGIDPNDEGALALATSHLAVVTEQVRAYTRGVGFDPDTGTPDVPLAAVIVSAAARSTMNPTGAIRMSFGELRTEPGVYAGFTLAEQAILHNYRKRWT